MSIAQVHESEVGRLGFLVSLPPSVVCVSLGFPAS